MLGTIIKLIEKLGEYLANILNIIGYTALIALIPCFFWLVFGRYILNETPTWVEQISLLLILFITFPIAATSILSNSHLSVSFFRNALPTKISAFLAIITYLLMIWFGFWMLLSSIEMMNFNWTQKIPIIHISESWRWFPMIISGFGIAFYSFLHILRIIYYWSIIIDAKTYDDNLLDQVKDNQ